MLLAIDIGNTNITIGVFDGEGLRVTWTLTTSTHRMPDEYAIYLLNLLSQHGLSKSDIKDVALCSVVPPLTTTFEEVSQRYLGISPLVIRAGVKTGVRIRMDNPREVGADRIANAAAAHHLYGGPIIIVDLGTATTFDTVSKQGDYLGGAIAPGLTTASEALFTRAAQLYQVELVAPKHAIGTDTITAMQSGILFGYVGLVESLVARIQQELGEKAKVIATGGYAGIIAKETTIIELVNPTLTLIGVRLIYQMNKA